MEEPKTVSDKLILDVAEAVVAEGDPELLNRWLNTLEGIQKQADRPETLAHRALLEEFSALLLRSPEACLARLEVLLASGLSEVAMLMTLCLGLDMQAVERLQPLFAAYREAQLEIQIEMRKLWEMPVPGRMELERAWVLRFLEDKNTGC